MNRPKNPAVLRRRVSQALLLFILPSPLFIEVIGSLLDGEIMEVLYASLALCGYYGAGALMRKGLLQEAVLDLRRYVVRPPRPWKLVASVLVGVTTVFTSAMLVEAHNLFESLVYGVGAGLGSVLLYGRDPQKRWNAADMDAGRQAEVAEALEQAESKIMAIESSNDAIPDQILTEQLNRISGQAREILGLLADNPTQVRNARRFLNTYLDGAHDVADGYARSLRDGSSGQRASEFQAILDTVEQTFAEQRSRLMEDEAMDLDVKIEVLKTQLEKEGI